MKMRWTTCVFGRATAAALALGSTTQAPAQVTEIVSLTPNNTAGNRQTRFVDVSLDGRFVVFHSDASDLVPSDNNNTGDVFLRDRATNTTTRISVGMGGAEANGGSTVPTISSDGNVIVFMSWASNLVPNDFNNALDIFVYDRTAQSISLASVTPSGVSGNGPSEIPMVSRSGRYVQFRSAASDLVVAQDVNGQVDAFVRDLWLGVTTMVSTDGHGNQVTSESHPARLSENGRYAVFTTDNPLVPADTNNAADIYRKDLWTGAVLPISTSTSGVFGNHGTSLSLAVNYRPISDDGRYVAFASLATNLVPGDTNRTFDVFVKDTKTGATTRVSVSSQGAEGLVPSSTSVVSISYSISGDGRFVVFDGGWLNIAPNDGNAVYDVFLRDRHRGTTTLVSENAQGFATNGYSHDLLVSEDPRYIGFNSWATDHPTGVPVNGIDYQTYVRDLQVTFGISKHLIGGCNGVGEIPTLECTPPVLGSTLTLSGSHLQPHALGALFWSRANTTPTAQSGPCSIYLDLNAFDTLGPVIADPAGDWSYSLPVANAPLLTGLSLTVQGLFLTGNPGSLALTDARTLRLGQ